MQQVQNEMEAELLIIRDWHKAAEYLAGNKKFLDDLDVDPFPGCGKAGYEYLRALTLRLADDAEMQEKAAPRPHHLMVDLAIKRGEIIDRSVVVTVFPLHENAYRIAIARADDRCQGTPTGVFDLEGAVNAIKQAVREIWHNT